MKKGKGHAEVASMDHKRKSDVRVSLPPGSGFAKDLKGAGLGDTMTMVVKGKVNSFRSDEYDTSLSLEITELHLDGGMAGDVKHLKRHRTEKPTED